MRYAIALAIGLIASNAMASSVTEELKNACANDAVRFCTQKDMFMSLGGDQSAITVCFRRHHHEISEMCRVALIKHGTLSKNEH